MKLIAGFTNIDVIAQKDSEEPAYVVRTDKQLQWQSANGGQQPPVGMEFEDEGVVWTPIADYAVWSANGGDVMNRLSSIASILDSSKGNPMEAIPKIQAIVIELITFVKNFDALVAELEFNGQREMKKIIKAKKKGSHTLPDANLSLPE